MDALLRTLLSAQRGVCSTRDADRVGATPVYLHRLVRDGELVRVRRGAFVDAVRLGEATSEQRFELGARAILRSRPGDIASHHTALALMGLPLWGVDLARFDVCTAVTHVSVSGGLVKHPWLGGAMVRWPDGVTTLDVARAVTTTAAASGVEAALVAADRALHDRRLTLDELTAAVANAPGAVARARSGEVLRLVDPLSESAGETRTRLILSGAGLRFQSQAPLRGVTSSVFAYADFLVEGVVVVEFDGRVKYRAASNGAKDAEEVVWAEKRREDRTREQGYEVVRITWSDLDHPELVLRKVRAALTRAMRRAAPGTAAGLRSRR